MRATASLIGCSEIEYKNEMSDMVNKSKGNYAYTMIDVETSLSKEIIEKLEAIKGVFRVRVVK